MVLIWGARSSTPERRRHSHETQAGRGAAPSNLNTSLTPGTAAQTNQQQARTRAGENFGDGGALADHSSSETDLPSSQSTNGRYANSAHSLPFRRTHTRMGSTTVLFLFSILLLLHPQPSSPSSIGLNLVDTLRRKLLQVAKTYTTKTPDDTHLKLCETDLCDSRRPDGPLGQGLCDRWARGEKGKCPDEQIFHVQGDPGTNDKAEMFFNLRSPWDVKCEKVLGLPLCRCACSPPTRSHGAARLQQGRCVSAACISVVGLTRLSYTSAVDQGKCVPAIGSVYNVYVAEGCIPERDYISEMQDTSDRVSKQVKIYLRRCVWMSCVCPCLLGKSSHAANKTASCRGMRITQRRGCRGMWKRLSNVCICTEKRSSTSRSSENRG